MHKRLNRDTHTVSIARPQQPMLPPTAANAPHSHMSHDEPSHAAHRPKRPFIASPPPNLSPNSVSHREPSDAAFCPIISRESSIHPKPNPPTCRPPTAPPTRRPAQHAAITCHPARVTRHHMPPPSMGGEANHMPPSAPQPYLPRQAVTCPPTDPSSIARPPFRPSNPPSAPPSTLNHMPPTAPSSIGSSPPLPNIIHDPPSAPPLPHHTSRMADPPSAPSPTT